MATERKTEQPAIAAKIESGFLVLTFSNGQTLTANPRAMSEEIQGQLIFHGLKQKLVDAAAIPRDPATGRAAGIDTKFQAVAEVLDRLNSGAWNKTREGGGNGGLLFTALCRLYATKTPEYIREYLDARSDAEQAALRKTSKVAAMIEAIRAERATDNGIDGNELLGELDD